MKLHARCFCPLQLKYAFPRCAACAVMIGLRKTCAVTDAQSSMHLLKHAGTSSSMLFYVTGDPFVYHDVILGDPHNYVYVWTLCWSHVISSILGKARNFTHAKQLQTRSRRAPACTNHSPRSVSWPWQCRSWECTTPRNPFRGMEATHPTLHSAEAKPL